MKLCWSDIYFRRVSLSFLDKLIKSSGSWVGGLTKELKFTLLAAASYPRYHITTKRPYRSNTNKTTSGNTQNTSHTHSHTDFD